MKELLTSEEVAGLLRVPKKTLDRWAYIGSGPVYAKVGRYRRYSVDDVERWLQRQRNGGPP